MQGTSETYEGEQPSTVKTKKQAQREYRLKEIIGFDELHQALQEIDPTGIPERGNVTRLQVLTKATEQIRQLASENRDLSLQVPARDYRVTPIDPANMWSIQPWVHAPAPLYGTAQPAPVMPSSTSYSPRV
ncbi:hypothetical protein HYDPIDRAFT_28371 [Hydnomerulius pinastri MD-312]|uniref:BHLH domain-containing protein n=1 Tax=Hydnomerulius pinastri MD-312 TaxID=994086 RepID=A0A0C9WF22_9AGAM|nr:hypothetical protein HYDPIDRAFT_28371 [Hydnomerulius pinastri MD-312]